MLRIAIFFSQPTQHHAPWFRAIAATGEADLHIFYYDPGQTLPAGGFDRDFGVTYQWDVPLLAGYHYTILPPLVNQGLSPLSVNRHLLAALQGRPWDAVFVAGYTKLNNWLVAAAASFLGLPVLHFCDANLLTPTGLLKKMVKEPVIRTFFALMSGFLYAGDHNYGFYLHYGVSPEKLLWCPIPIEISRFIPPPADRLAALRQRYEIPDEARVILFVGKLIQRKRPLDLVQALARLNSNRKVIGLFVGEGPLREEIRQTGGSRVRITGFVNQSEMSAHYALGEVLAMTSEHDPHPLAVTEAAALGVPAVISHRCGCYGPRDILRVGENGLVYLCGDVDELAASLELLLSDEPLRQKMAARARELALTQDVTVAARATINAVKDLKNRHKSNL